MDKKTVKIAVDAMGGDKAPGAVIQGCVDALAADKDIFIYLTGDEALLKRGLSGLSYDEDRLEIVPSTEVITNEEHPAFAIKKKRNSSIVIAQRLVREGKADAFVSAGSTGAILVGGQILIGRLKGVHRPALAPLMPTTKGITLLIDCGANMDAKPTNLVQFAQMGSIYMKDYVGIKNPTVGILNVGAEEAKGNELVRETFPLLKECQDINFIGSVEARDIPLGAADVVVTDAFAGNVALKMYEGSATAILTLLKNTLTSSLKTKIGAALIIKDLKSQLKAYDVSQYGGAPMLGLKGLVVKAHGSSDAKEIATAIGQAAAFIRKDIIGKISEAVSGEKERTEAHEAGQAGGEAGDRP